MCLKHLCPTLRNINAWTYVGLLEPFPLIFRSSVGYERGVLALDRNEILMNKLSSGQNSAGLTLLRSLKKKDLTRQLSYHQGEVADFDIIQRPLAKELYRSDRLSHGCKNVTGYEIAFLMLRSGIK